jgi:uncharacterized membrane protein
VLFDATPLDIAALAWFLIVWLGYGWFASHIPGRPIGLNHHMVAMRRMWMERMLDRENRIVDSQLIGHTIHSVTFFASTTMLVLAGLIGAFEAVGPLYQAISGVSFVVQTSKAFFAGKMLLLVALFVHSFFKFTWSLRQFNYLLAMIGSAPQPPVPPGRRVRAARAIAAMLTQAVGSFTAGLRGYYFAFAALAWFIQPWVFIVVTTGMLGVLFNRQMRSPSFRAIRHHSRQLGVDAAPVPTDIESRSKLV